jgi:predicted kinase
VTADHDAPAWIRRRSSGRSHSDPIAGSTSLPIHESKGDAVSTLVLLNGPPASGKSTIAARLVAHRPLALNLDIDVIRALLGDWKARPADAGIAVRRLALAMALEHLNSGHDVVVPQFLARGEFIDQLAETTATAGARFVEVALILSRADAIGAFERRSTQPDTAGHRDAAEAVERAGGRVVLAAMYDDFVTLLQSRPSALRVEVAIGDIDATVDTVEAAISTGG